jgi:hypothetical protein
MTSKVEFFCSPGEERQVLQYLTQTDGTQVFDVRGGHIKLWDTFSTDKLPDWPEALAIYLWQPSHGPLIWHTSRPKIKGPTHASLVINLFTQRVWDEHGLKENDKLLDTDLSPILSYQRGVTQENKLLPNCAIAPPSNLLRAGYEYERWVRRCLAWIRRRGTIVHHWRKEATTIPNPHSLLNTVYAFPEALKEIESGSHGFTIS